MSDRQYVHFGHRRSWHIVRTPTRMFNTYITLCGRTVVSLDLMAELPAAKSCESCLRIQRRQDDPAPGGVVPGSEPQLIVAHSGEIIKPIDDDASTHDELVP